MLVDTILRSKGVVVHTLPETASLADAVAKLNAHNIGALVITHAEGDIVGILSERDIVRQLGTNAPEALSRSVGDCMTRGVVTCARDTDIAEVMERMTRRRIRHMPVTDAGRLVGIISIGDVVKHKIEQVEHEAAALKEYISS